MLETISPRKVVIIPAKSKEALQTFEKLKVADTAEFPQTRKNRKQAMRRR